jgi:hypothetical protein
VIGDVRPALIALPAADLTQIKDTPARVCDPA